MVANWTHMRRTGLALVGAALLIFATACGGGGGAGSAASGSSSSVANSAPATTTTVAVTTTTLSAEEQVKAAWAAYWQEVDRLLKAPNPDDEQLPTVAAEPLLSFLKDDFAARAAEGRTVVVPDGALYSHRLEAVNIAGTFAQVTGCELDDSLMLGPDGSVIDDSKESRRLRGIVSNVGGKWLVSDMRVVQRRQGTTGCDGL